MYLSTPYKILYNTNKHPFKKIISEMLDLSETNSMLENLHKIKHYDILTRESDQHTIWHQKYYQKFNKKFLPHYKKLIEELKETFVYNEIIFQKIPTFRVQLANGNVAVGEWHKDKIYNHGMTEVTFWLPFMDTDEKNTIWLESKEDKTDYKPYKVNYGEILVFDGSNLTHGNKPNTGENTRVSIDFRLVDPKKFISSNLKSINTKTKFTIGDYFDIL
jgi:ectoine hydroxylase-related dioxygenase (phytanoyl-CoA dioxygenase family)